jgi:predicted MFS family arabinose efflux permease
VNGVADAPRVGYGDALRSHEFRALFAAQAVSIAGASVAAVALTVLVYDRTGSPFLSSLTFALGFVPYVFGGGLLSSAVDRVRPRRLVNACDGTSAAIAAVMAWPGLPVASLLVLLFVLGTLAAVGGGARSALLRSTVSDAAYVPARSLLKVASQIAQIGGNAVGGALVVVLGTSGAILVNSASFAVAFVLVRLLVGDHDNPALPGGAGLLRDSLRGAREILGRPELARLLALGWLVPMFSVAPEALAAPYISSHGGSPRLVGWWLAALPLGTIVGDVAGVRFLGPALQRRVVGAVAAAGFVPYLVFGLDPPVAAALALLVVSGACGMYSLGLDGLVRNATPDRLFARTMTLNSAGLMTLQGVGFALAGAVAEQTGAARAVALAGVCGLVAVAALWGLARRAAGTSAPAPNVPA